jgi:gamma-glutamylcyclotransferase (GGCT)/AIG2-like uncharacterized protein YtfP
MSQKRMEERGIEIFSKKSGILENYKMIINKKSFKNPEIGFANIIQDENSIVEGVVYDIDEKDVKILDKYEGFPNHYLKYFLNVKIDNNKEKCLIYIAKSNWTTKNEIKTTIDYKNYILEGKEFLSENYYENLKKIKI